jgi:hypothetical protein
MELVNLYMDWDSKRGNWLAEKAETQRYIYATDTTKTTNAQLPWKNKTTIPKLCQIRDNLFANYMAAMFPKNCWLYWHGDTLDDQTKKKSEAIESLMQNTLERPEFKSEIAKVVLDYIDYGMGIVRAEWIDDSYIVEDGSREKVGYNGPLPKRISPVDIAFNPIAPSFYRTGKFERSLMTLGDLAKVINQQTSPDNAEAYQKLFDYLSEIRTSAHQTTGVGEQVKNTILNVAGFTDFVAYLRSGYVEVLTFYGDYYDINAKKLHRNVIVTIVDRHKLVNIIPNPSDLGHDGFYAVPWRVRQDSLWAMGPLDNLVGMQYRVDHIENLKADIFDLVAAPPLLIKGLVEDFKWGPFERIYVGDDGDVKVLAPEGNVLNANLEIQNLMNLMEEMAGSPKEAAGFRTPGEKTAYEVQRLENAAARIFQSKIKQFEEQILEPLLNDMLEMYRRKMKVTTIRVFDEETNSDVFVEITKEDISGSGRIKPMAARNFAERAEKVQNLNEFYASAVGQDPDIKVHFSSEKLAYLIENLLDLDDYGIVKPYIRLTEQQKAASLHNAGTEQQLMEAGTPAGITPGDTAPPPQGGINFGG